MKQYLFDGEEITTHFKSSNLHPQVAPRHLASYADIFWARCADLMAKKIAQRARRISV